MFVLLALHLMVACGTASGGSGGTARWRWSSTDRLRGQPRRIRPATALKLGTLSRMSGPPREHPCVGGERWAWSAAEQRRGRSDRRSEIPDSRPVACGAELRAAAPQRPSPARTLAAGLRDRSLALSELRRSDEGDRGDHRQARCEDARARGLDERCAAAVARPRTTGVRRVFRRARRRAACAGRRRGQHSNGRRLERGEHRNGGVSVEIFARTRWARRMMQRAYRRRQFAERFPAHARATGGSAAVRTPQTPRSRVMISTAPLSDLTAPHCDDLHCIDESGRKVLAVGGKLDRHRGRGAPSVGSKAWLRPEYTEHTNFQRLLRQRSRPGVVTARRALATAGRGDEQAVRAREHRHPWSAGSSRTESACLSRRPNDDGIL